MTDYLDLSDKITFLTVSLGTKWESYSQSLIKIYFPECSRIIVDGSQSWNPIYFTDYGDKVSSDYLILIDEDCFILSRNQLIFLIKLLDKDKNCALIATPDGGTYHRDYNPIACNTFFAIIKRRALLKITNNIGWKSYKYSDVSNMADKKHVDFLDKSRVNYDKCEPYYPFFWALLKNNFTIKYLIPTLNRDLLASEIRIGKSNDQLLIHMWWLRSWHCRQLDPYLKVANYDRYFSLEKKYLLSIFIKPSNRVIFLKKNLIRIINKVYFKFRSRVFRISRIFRFCMHR